MLLLTALPPDLLQLMLSKLQEKDLMAVTQVNGAMAAACEPVLKNICGRHFWRYPRRPRRLEDAADGHIFPWRALYYKHACRGCGAVGEFPVRGSVKGLGQLFLMCRACALSNDAVQNRMIRENVLVDTLSLEGRKLLREKPKKRTSCVRAVSTVNGL